MHRPNIYLVLLSLWYHVSVALLSRLFLIRNGKWINEIFLRWPKHRQWCFRKHLWCWKNRQTLKLFCIEVETFCNKHTIFCKNYLRHNKWHRSLRKLAPLLSCMQINYANAKIIVSTTNGNNITNQNNILLQKISWRFVVSDIFASWFLFLVRILVVCRVATVV